MRPVPRDFLPLKDLTFQILIVLADGEQHGRSIGEALEAVSSGGRVMPGHLYRTLDRMVSDGLVDERDQPRDQLNGAHTEPGKRGTPPSRFFRLTPLGRQVTSAETDRLAALVARARAGTAVASIKERS